jgi:Ser/Thr protein kinase RdoA (MazF antagonist)
MEPTTDPDALAGALRRHYGFADVTIGERLEGGYANDVFRVSADGDEFVLRVKRPPVDGDDIAWEHRLLARLAERLDEVQAPLTARDGGTSFTWEDRAAWLLPFVAGAPADAGREADRLAAAAALGRLHRAAGALDAGPRPQLEPLRRLVWPPLLVPLELWDRRAEIVEARTWAIRFVAEIAETRRLPETVVHGDFFPGNALVAGGRVTGIVDWEEAHVDWATWDLATAMWSFCHRGDDLDRERAVAFVAAYRAAGGTAPEADDDLLLPLVRVKRVLEVLRARTDREPLWDLQRENLRALAHLPTRPG